MSNNPNHMPNYQHIETLVRDLHTAKNIAQPEKILHLNANHPNKPVLMTTNPCQSIVSNAHHRLRVHKLSPVHPPPTLGMIIDEEEFVGADDRVDGTNNMKSDTNHPLDVPLTHQFGNTSITTPKCIGNDVNCTTIIPSVMVNDVNEPLDLISTTQRRFSQLYLGLRRLSTSNTVGIA